MAINKSFSGAVIHPPGNWSGRSPEYHTRMRLIKFLHKLGVKTFLRKWPEHNE